MSFFFLDELEEAEARAVGVFCGGFSDGFDDDFDGGFAPDFRMPTQ